MSRTATTVVILVLTHKLQAQQPELEEDLAALRAQALEERIELELMRNERMYEHSLP